MIDMNKLLTSLKHYDENKNPSTMLETAVLNGELFGDLFSVFEKITIDHFWNYFDNSPKKDDVEKIKKKLLNIPPFYNNVGYF